MQTLPQLSGEGYRTLPETKECQILLEVWGLAEDEEGNADWAGIAIKLGPYKEFPTEEDFKKQVQFWVENGIEIPSMEGERFKCRPLTWEKYSELGYNDK